MKKIGLIILIVLAVLLIFRDFFIKQAIVSVGSSVLGAPLHVGKFSLSLLSSKLSMSDVKLYNPSTFSANPLIDVAHVNVDYNLGALMKGKMYFSLIDLDVRQLAIERNKEGVYNVSSLKITPQKSEQQDQPKVSSKNQQKPLDMRIDLLKINVDKVTLREPSQAGQFKETNQGIGLKKKVFKNITSPQQLVALVLFEASGLGPLKNLAMATTKEVIRDVGRVANKVTGQAKETVGSVLGSLKNVVSK